MRNAHGTYIGHEQWLCGVTKSGRIYESLNGQGALLMIDGDIAHAQFDDLMGLPFNLTHKWGTYPLKDFNIDWMQDA
jgi:hypothetical protein